MKLRYLALVVVLFGISELNCRGGRVGGGRAGIGRVGGVGRVGTAANFRSVGPSTWHGGYYGSAFGRNWVGRRGYGAYGVPVYTTGYVDDYYGYPYDDTETAYEEIGIA